MIFVWPGPEADLEEKGSDGWPRFRSGLLAFSGASFEASKDERLRDESPPHGHTGYCRLPGDYPALLRLWFRGILGA
jgi:hypothetical protein